MWSSERRSLLLLLLLFLYQLVEASVGKQAVIEIAPEQPGDVDRTCADITKAKALLGRCAPLLLLLLLR